MRKEAARTVAEMACAGARSCVGHNLYIVCAIRGNQSISMGCLPGDIDPAVLASQDPEKYRDIDRFTVQTCGHPHLCSRGIHGDKLEVKKDDSPIRGR